MTSRTLSLLAAGVAVAALFATPSADARDRGRGGSGGNSGNSAAASANRDIRLGARLTATGVRGKANVDYRERARRGTVERKFKVQVERFAPGTVLEVRVGSQVVGTLTASSLGRAQIELTNRQDDSPSGDEQPLPPGFPAVTTGTAVTVGPLSGAVARR